MIAQHYKDMLGAKSVIRQISEWSTARGKEIGHENVFDYSLGNPSVPCPPQFTETCEDLLKNTDPVQLHGDVYKRQAVGDAGGERRRGPVDRAQERVTFPKNP